MERRHLSGLDWGRALAAPAVVAWHSQAVGRTDVLEPSYTGGLGDAAGVVYYDVLLLAVPLFMTISLFLYARGRADGTTTLGRRALRIGALAVFWIALTALFRGVGRIDGGQAPRFVLSGGHSIFWFFVQLLLLTALVELAFAAGVARRPRVLAAGLALTTGALLLRVPLGKLLPHGDLVTSYWGTLNFLPYAFLGMLLALAPRRPPALRPWHAAAAAGAYVAIAAAEWAWLPSRWAGETMPAYARPSLVLGAGAIVALLAWRDWRPRWPVRLLAELSLGVYCIHLFVLEHLDSIFPRVDRLHSGAGPAVFAAGLALTIAIAYPLRRRLVV